MDFSFMDCVVIFYIMYIIIFIIIIRRYKAKAKWFVIEGNIGSGKSSLLARLRINDNKWEKIPEPVNLWLEIKDDKGKNLLEAFYENPERYAHLFQTVVTATRIGVLLEKQNNKKNIISERSPWTDRIVFGKLCIDSGKMNSLEARSFTCWCDILLSKFVGKPDGIIYLQTSPEKCMERMKKRGRNEESSVSYEYLEKVHEYHENWIYKTNIPVLIIDNNYDNNWENVIKQVKDFINN